MLALGCPWFVGFRHAHNVDIQIRHGRDLDREVESLTQGGTPYILVGKSYEFTRQRFRY